LADVKLENVRVFPKYAIQTRIIHGFDTAKEEERSLLFMVVVIVFLSLHKCI
jgi:hypothetical protein